MVETRSASKKKAQYENDENEIQQSRSSSSKVRKSLKLPTQSFISHEEISTPKHEEYHHTTIITEESGKKKTLKIQNEKQPKQSNHSGGITSPLTPKSPMQFYAPGKQKQYKQQRKL